jgi:TorA maturation chaperone TorD
MTKEFRNGDRNILKAYNMMLYFAGTMIMWDPSNECIHDFWSKGMFKSLPVSSQNPMFLKAAALLRNSVTDIQSSHERMKDDFQALFSGNVKSLAPPYESVYRDKDGILFGKQASEVREFYRSYGWESRFRDEIPDDHLGIELLFLTLMIEKYFELEDKACQIEMRTEIRRFISTHLLSWITRWNDDIQNNAITMSYKGIGALICASIEDVYHIMDDSAGNRPEFMLN